MLKVLIPINGTHNSQIAIEHVIAEFRKNTAMEIHLLNVQPPFRRDVTQFINGRTLRDFHLEEAQKALAPVREQLNAAGVPFAVHIEVGDLAKAVTDAAKRLHCDRILLATARKNSLARMVENSLTNKIIERTTVPVEVIAADDMSKWERYGIPAGVGAAVMLVLAAVD